MKKHAAGKRPALVSIAIVAALCLLILPVSSCSTKQTTGSPSTAGTSAGQSQTTAASTAASSATTQGERAQDIFVAYGNAWVGLDYAGMYRLLSATARERIPEAAFIKRYTDIMKGLEIRNLQIRTAPVPSTAPQGGDTFVQPFIVGMETMAGPAVINGYQMKLIRETVDGKSVWRVDWTEKLIFPNMEPNDRVRARVLPPKRGSLVDRNNKPLAVNDQLIVIGVVPSRFNAVKDTAIPQMAALLGIAADKIAKTVAAATNPEWFIPIVTLPSGAKDLSAKLTAFDGVQYQKAEGRSYPAGEFAALLTGYIGPITAEELKKYPNEGYSETDKIGKMGLEQVYEKRLRGTSGAEIYLVPGDSEKVKALIARKDPVDGETIRLAIDLTVQQRLYAEMKSEAGAAAAIHPRTGEILALVSTPSFDPNLLQTYVPDAVRNTWNTAPKPIFISRFKAGYAPGSVFKLVTAAIGLKSQTLKPEEAIPISGLQWQKDASWGAYKVTRVKDIGRPVNLRDALVYSDNIYFAMQAIRVGQKNYEAGAAAFGIGENLPGDYPFNRSQIANSGLKNEVLLADTGYGQGEVLVSPIHIALFYSALANNGDIPTPILELKTGQSASVWKPQAIPSAHVPMLIDYLRQVVDNPAGTAYTKTPTTFKLLGKTGTAELKKSLTDTTAQENGWFVAMNVEDPRLTVAMLIEDVKGRGGSHYVVPLVKRAMDDILKGATP